MSIYSALPKSVRLSFIALYTMFFTERLIVDKNDAVLAFHAKQDLPLDPVYWEGPVVREDGTAADLRYSWEGNIVHSAPIRT